MIRRIGKMEKGKGVAKVLTDDDRSSPDTPLAAVRRPRLLDTLRACADPRIAAMLALGFASGLPFMLVSSTFFAWLAETNIPLTSIGLTSYLGFVLLFRFLWAPLIDRYSLPLLGRWFGRSRAWLLLSQFVMAAGILGMSLIDPASDLVLMLVMTVIVRIASATQDMAMDAWRIGAARDEHHQAIMAAAMLLGARIGLLSSGAGALYVADYSSWQTAYMVMAALVGVGVIGTLGAVRLPDSNPVAPDGEPQDRVGVLGRLRDAIIVPATDFLIRHGRLSLLILATLGFYRLPDFLTAAMVNPFYIDLGFTKSEIASVSKIVGISMMMVGTVAGAWAAVRVGTMRMLVLSAILASVTNLGFAWLAIVGPDVRAMAIVVSLENFVSGFCGPAFVAYVSSLTSRSFTATQYTLLSTFFILPGQIGAGLSGYMVGYFDGFYGYFVATAAMGLPGIALAILLLRATQNMGTGGARRESGPVDTRLSS